MMDNLLDRAADAARRAHVIDPDYPTQRPAARLAMWRARQARDLAAVLGIDIARVTISRDPRRSQLRPGAQLLTVDLTDTLDDLIVLRESDPYGSFPAPGPFGPPDRLLLPGLLRFIPIPGFEALSGTAAPLESLSPPSRNWPTSGTGPS